MPHTQITSFLPPSNTLPCLPTGIYAVSSQFRDRDGEVTVHFRGTTYRAVIGVNAFGRFDHMSAAADRVPEAPFEGRVFDVPVAIVPSGVYTFRQSRAELDILLARPIAILGEAMGISPNAPGNLSLPNARRNCSESILEGSFYFGQLVLTDPVPGVLTVDGLVLRNTRLHDRRTGGTDLGIEVHNCIFDGAHSGCMVQAHPLTDPTHHRTITLRDCRLDGFDSMEGKGHLISGCADRLTLERLYFANTKEFFGLSDYARETVNVPPHVPASIIVRECLFSRCTAIRGLTFVLPPEAEQVNICVEDCSFHDFVPPGTPTIYALLPNSSCRLTVRNTSITSTQITDTAILVDGFPDAPVSLDAVTLEGVRTPLARKPPRRTTAPQCIGQTVWSRDRLADPHPVSPQDTRTLCQLEALYSGRTALYGDMHTHTDSGGTSDGKTPLGLFVRQLRELGLDFAAVVDHNQIRHCLLPEWDSQLLICGTEPGTILDDDHRPARARKMDFCMLFQHPSDYFRVMDAFPEFSFSGGPDGHNSEPRLTPQRMGDLSRFLHSLGGLLVHAHPRQLIASDNPLDYYFGDDMPLETIQGHPASFNTVQNLSIWDALLKLGKRVHTHGCSDTHDQAVNCALTTVYCRERRGADILQRVRDGDCSAGGIGIKMMIGGTCMGGHLPWREGLVLAVALDDCYRSALSDHTVYCLKVFTDRGLAYASEFDGSVPQRLTLPVLPRLYYRIEVTNESDDCVVAISNPIWLDNIPLSPSSYQE